MVDWFHEPRVGVVLEVPEVVVRVDEWWNGQLVALSGADGTFSGWLIGVGDVGRCGRDA